jgi:hypothetical protein
MMQALRRHPGGEGRWVGALAIAGVLVLVVGVGCCLFDDHGASTHGPLGSCLGMVAVPLAVVSLGPLLASGWAASAYPLAGYRVAHHIPAPPPKRPLSV